MQPAATRSLYHAQQARVVETIAGARAEWSRTSSPSQFGRIASRLFSLIGAAQLGAARDGAAMVPAALEQTGYPEKALGRVNPAVFVGWSSEGYRLDSLLWLTPAIAGEAGGPLVQQMLAGQSFLDRIVRQQVQDAARIASGTAIAATRNTGWVRYVNPPCCQDCAILAGRWYRYNTGFERHPNCDCQHRPASSREAPAGYTDTVPLDQIHDLTAAQRRAIEDGSDINQVVNAYRRASRSRRTKMRTTSEGMTRRGWAGRRTRGRRLTPEAIYSTTRSREDAVRLLAENGYIIT